jgi:hypothetical protein
MLLHMYDTVQMGVRWTLRHRCPSKAPRGSDAAAQCRTARPRRPRRGSPALATRRRRRWRLCAAVHMVARKCATAELRRQCQNFYMNALQSIRDRVRSLAGEQCPRQLPRRSAKPRIGARIVQVESSVRLTVLAGLSDELWIWLLDRGWRVVTHRPDRRRYRDISWSRVTRLFDCDPTSRERLMVEAIRDAESRPTVGNRSSS